MAAVIFNNWIAVYNTDNFLGDDLTCAPFAYSKEEIVFFDREGKHLKMANNN